MKIYKLLFLISHPVQYFSPLFRELSKHPQIDLTACYCSAETVEGVKDVIGFNKEIKWDIPLLEGHQHIFLKNYSPSPSIYFGFFGLMNFGIINEMRKGQCDALVVHGWNYFTHVLAMVTARLLSKKVMLRGENPLSHELLKPYWKRLIKKIVLQYGIFKLIDVFLYVGEENKKFYEYYSVPNKKLIFTPYSVENERFYGEYLKLKDRKGEFRKKLGLPVDNITTIFIAKLIDKKRPFDLLKAYEKVKSEKRSLVFIGDGHLRKELEDYVAERKLNNVYFTGFKNQTELPLYYIIADILVLPSGLGETWGLVINEAMNFELPVLVSDLVGCSKDLVGHSLNGFIFKAGDIAGLANYLEILIWNESLRKKMGKTSLEIVKKYGYERDILGVIEALGAACGK